MHPRGICPPSWPGQRPNEDDAEPDGYYIPYSGPHDVDEQTRTVSHQVQMSVIPTWVGTTHIRSVQFRVPAMLELSASQPPPGESAMSRTAIIWSRQPLR